MSANGEIYTAEQKFYTAAGSNDRGKSHLCLKYVSLRRFESKCTMSNLGWDSSIVPMTCHIWTFDGIFTHMNFLLCLILIEHMLSIEVILLMK